jgi:acetyl-CoA carboxylase biotin carboxyl carrier protein
MHSAAAGAQAASSAAQAAPGAEAAPQQTAAAPEPPEEELHVITSPIVGTFYRASSPNAEPFIKVGSQVEPDTVVCIIEAMKLMNEIQAETAGTVAKIYVENGQPVEYGQPLFGVKK